jgi:branched-chain amino acid transport system substrate-binding protein
VSVLRSAIVWTLLASPWAAATADDPPPRPPDVDFRQRSTPYDGPGRDRPEPVDVPEILIGYFGPDDPDHPRYGDAWKAAHLAVERANREGGFQGKPFRLVPVWSDTPWSAGAALLAKLVYQRHVWAIVGGPDGSTTHLAEQIVAKARLPLVSPISGDRTANAANVPWIVSLLPADPLQVPVLRDRLARVPKEKGFAIVSADDHDSRMFVRALENSLKEKALTPRISLVVAAGRPDRDRAVVPDLAASGLDAVVIVGDAATSARIVRSLRERGFTGRILGTVAMAREEFRTLAGAEAEGVVFPLVYEPGRDGGDFERAFRDIGAGPPDFTAAFTYDGVRLVIAAVRRAGLNRVRIGDALRELAPFPGVTGILTWDSMGGNVQVVPAGTIRSGRIQRLDLDQATP